MSNPFSMQGADDMIRHHRSGLAVGAFLVLPVICSGCLSLPYEHHVTLTPRISVREDRLRQYSAITGMAHNGSLPVILPIPSKSDDVVEQTALRDGEVVGKFGRYASFHPSPNERFLVVEPGLHMNPIVIVDMDQGRSVPVNAPTEGIEGHDFVYPFGFVRWAPDSSSFFVEAQGSTYSKSKEGLNYYKELWEVDARSAHAIRRNRQEGLKPDLSALPPDCLKMLRNERTLPARSDKRSHEVCENRMLQRATDSASRAVTQSKS